MKTIITTLVKLDQGQVSALLDQAAFTDFTPTGFDQSGRNIVITANRFLTSDEKATLTTCFMANLFTVEDGEA